ncbi:uncharacterized protein LOC131223147 [Magnolia sinica]|uniref:uncharacterized protein LOC131223147 n=1 Tax=Magnolia sinica TaxID=86752 RepID=UPI002657D052|nr:uncharacterized protein LOC131223147 [Magnolia sinica]
MALARLYLKNFHPRVFTLPSKVVNSTKQSWESEIRWFSTAPTTTDKASSDGKSNGREVAVSEGGGGRLKPSLRKRRRPWSNQRGLVPFRLPDFFPRTGFGNVLMQVPENLNKILE